MKPHAITICLSVAALSLTTASAQTLSNDALVKALQLGGQVIVMRHASSPRETPDAKTVNADNPTHERQLDQTGQTTAIAMGKALHQLQIPIGQVFSSPTYRALETAHLAQFPKPITVAELSENGQSMAATTDTQSEWLKKKVTVLPKGTNTLIVTHLPNITRAFPQWSSGLADGEALVFGPDGKGSITLLGRVKIEDWPKLHP